MTIVATSQRLALRVPSMDDLDALATMWADPETMRFIGRGMPWTREEVAARIERARRTHDEHALCFWTILRQADSAVLGQAGVVPITFDGPELELGYRLGRAHWGHGYATEAARLARDHAFGTLGVERLVAVTHPENTPSRRVLTKVGFRETGESDKYYGVRSVRYALESDKWQSEHGKSGPRPDPS